MYTDDTVFKVPILIEPDEDGFHAYCPDLPGLHVDGDTKEEVVQNAKDATKGFLQSMLKHGDPIPPSIVHRKSQPVAPWSRIAEYVRPRSKDMEITAERREEQTVDLALTFA